MASTPLTMTLKGKIFIQFEGGELIELTAVELPFAVAVIAPTKESE